jgi:hypothetical protein
MIFNHRDIIAAFRPVVGGGPYVRAAGHGNRRIQ